jgi:hypothetical protein
MLIFLGKAHLGQSDKHVFEHTGHGGGPVRYSEIRRIIVDPAKPNGEENRPVPNDLIA